MMSVILATKDRRWCLPRAIDSVLAQGDPDWELVVLDNGESVADLIPDDPRILYVHRHASGPADAYDQALRLANGEHVMPLADDDWLDPRAVATAVWALADHEWGYGMTAYYRNGEMVDILGAKIGWDIALFRTWYYLGGAVFWRRALSDRLGGFDASYDHAADWELYLRFGEAATPAVVPAVMYHYWDHPGTDTNAHNDRQQAANAAIIARSA